MNRLDLPALDGANPLGFLAALGTLAVLSENDPSLKLGWKSGARWTPFLERDRPFVEKEAVEDLIRRLTPEQGDAAENTTLEDLRKDYDKALADWKNAQAEPRQQCITDKLLHQNRKQQLKELEEKCSQARNAYTAALKTSAPSLELGVGKLSQCKPAVYRSLADAAGQISTVRRRRVPDLLASFGIEQMNDKARGKVIWRTPFCFTTGSGHQEFISDARQLMTRKDPTKDEPNPPACVSELTVRKAIFEPWLYSDPGLSLRWDPLEDSRYALRLEDPGPIGVSTVWMANLLAYRALVFFPCAWDGRALATTAWSSDASQPCFTWPIWESPLTADTIRSLLQSPAFGQKDIHDFRAELRARGVVAVFRCLRIEVGSNTNKKINFSSATAV